MSFFKRTTCAQNIIEYVLVVSIVTAAAAAMSTYVYRAVQAKTQEISGNAR